MDALFFITPLLAAMAIFSLRGPRVTFAVQISFFKSISIIFGGAGLIFEGVTN
jgi:hypothetical protein